MADARLFEMLDSMKIQVSPHSNRPVIKSMFYDDVVNGGRLYTLRCFTSAMMIKYPWGKDYMRFEYKKFTCTPSLITFTASNMTDVGSDSDDISSGSDFEGFTARNIDISASTVAQARPVVVDSVSVSDVGTAVSETESDSDSDSSSDEVMTHNI